MTGTGPCHIKRPLGSPFPINRSECRCVKGLKGGEPILRFPIHSTPWARSRFFENLLTY